MDFGINPTKYLPYPSLYLKVYLSQVGGLKLYIFLLRNLSGPGNGQFCSPDTNCTFSRNKNMFLHPKHEGHGAGPSAASVSNMDTLAAIKATWVWVLGLDLKTHGFGTRKSFHKNTIPFLYLNFTGV